MKVDYSTDKENTQKEFFDNFYCIEKIVQFDHPEKFMKNRLICPVHSGILEGVYETELDTKTGF